KTHTLLQQPATQEATSPEIRRFGFVESVHLFDRQRLARQIRHLRHRQLHLRGQRITADARFQQILAAALVLVHRVELIEKRSTVFLCYFLDRTSGEEIVDGLPARLESHALMSRREKSARPVDRAARRQTACIGQNNKRRQLVRLRTQTVGQPRAQDGKTVEAKSAVLLER